MSSTVFLDIDRTLFDTDKATVAIWQKLAEMYNHLVAEHQLARMREFFVYGDDSSYYYDFSRHLQDLRLNVEEAYGRLHSSELADGRLQHKGANELVGWLRQNAQVSALTYGTDGYQRLKADLCPALNGVEVAIVQESKEIFLADKGAVWLVDDKVLGNRRPKDVKFIQVAIEDQSDQTNSDEFYVKTLAEALAILQKHS